MPVGSLIRELISKTLIPDRASPADRLSPVVTHLIPGEETRSINPPAGSEGPPAVILVILAVHHVTSPP